MKYILILCLITFATLVSGGIDCCPFKMHTKEAAEILNKSLTQFAAGGGPYYELVKVNSASHLLLGGILYKMKAELKELIAGWTKTCYVDIWTQSWIEEDGTTVTIRCPGEKKIVKTHNNVMSSAA